MIHTSGLICRHVCFPLEFEDDRIRGEPTTLCFFVLLQPLALVGLASTEIGIQLRRPEREPKLAPKGRIILSASTMACASPMLDSAWQLNECHLKRLPGLRFMKSDCADHFEAAVVIS